jgi:CDP-diacylglycerol--serine O-phosphatidyltransferase
MKSTLSMFNIPNLFTASNMLCGILAILLSVSGRIDLAPFAIYLGAILDFFDGFLARKLNQQGELGKQMDSLADMITFGVAPGVMMMVLLASVLNPTINTGNGTPLDWSVQISFALWIENIMTGKSFSFLPFLALIIPFFSIFRLAKFNIDTRQSDSFIGLNTPANTIFFTSFPLLCFYYQGDHSFAGELVRTIVTPSILVPLIILMSLLLVSEIPFFSFKFKHFKWKGNELRFLFLITCGILIPTILVWSIPIIILLYIILSVVENLFIKNKQYEV